MSGISLSGDPWLREISRQGRKAMSARALWFHFACCPQHRRDDRLAQLVTSPPLPDDAFFWIHIPAGFGQDDDQRRTRIHRLRVRLSLVWGVHRHSRSREGGQFELRLRIPGWADDVDTELPASTEESGNWDKGYAVFSKTWQKGDKLTVDLDIQAKWVRYSPKGAISLGRVTTRIPLIYCAEEHDLGFVPYSSSPGPNPEGRSKPFWRA